MRSVKRSSIPRGVPLEGEREGEVEEGEVDRGEDQSPPLTEAFRIGETMSIPPCPPEREGRRAGVRMIPLLLIS